MKGETQRGEVKQEIRLRGSRPKEEIEKSEKMPAVENHVLEKRKS